MQHAWPGPPQAPASPPSGGGATAHAPLVHASPGPQAVPQQASPIPPQPPHTVPPSVTEQPRPGKQLEPSQQAWPLAPQPATTEGGLQSLPSQARPGSQVSSMQHASPAAPHAPQVPADPQARPGWHDDPPQQGPPATPQERQFAQGGAAEHVALFGSHVPPQQSASVRHKGSCVQTGQAVQSSPGSHAAAVQGWPAPARGRHVAALARPGKHTAPTQGPSPIAPQPPHALPPSRAAQPIPTLQVLSEQQGALAAPHAEQAFWSQVVALGHEPPHVSVTPQLSSTPQAPTPGQTLGVQPHALGVPPPPHVSGAVHEPQLGTVRAVPQLSGLVTAPHASARRRQKAAFVSGVHEVTSPAGRESWG